MAAPDFDQMVQRYHLVLAEFFKGNPKPAVEFFSRGHDVSLANPFGGIARGREEAAKKAKLASTYYKDGRSVTFENIAKSVSGDMGYIVEIERCEAKVGGGRDMTRVGLRVTSIFRREDGAWKLVHRHADPFVSVQTK